MSCVLTQIVPFSDFESGAKSITVTLKRHIASDIPTADARSPIILCGPTDLHGMAQGYSLSLILPLRTNTLPLL